MRYSTRELACAIAGAAFAFGTHAQTPPATPGAQPSAVAPAPMGADTDPRRKAQPDPHPQAVGNTMPADRKAAADADYKAAQKACEAKGAAKDSCLKDARAAYDRAVGRKEAATPEASAPAASAPAPASPEPETKQK